jgi:tuftelin-interacting protein 11
MLIVKRAPTFVSGDKTQLQSGADKQIDVKGIDVDSSESDDGSTSSSGSDLSPSAAPSPRVRDEEDDEGPAHMGLGGSRRRDVGDSPLEGRQPGPRGAIGNSNARGGSSFAKAGIGARQSAPTDENEDIMSPSLGETPPLSEQERSRRTFKGREQAPPPVKATPLTSTEARHFQNISGTYGAKLLQKFGWNAGEGLGKDKSGRAVPVDAGRHLGGKGISSGIRSEDSKREARRRGEIVSEDEEEIQKRDKRGRQRATKEPKGQEQSWRKQKKVKVKVQHKTYEQLVAEAGDSSAAGIGLVLDARGGEVSSRSRSEAAIGVDNKMREVESLSALDLSGWTPTGENAQIPELRHNLRLVVDVTKSEVEALAREGRAVNEKTRWALREQDLARRKVDEGNLSMLGILVKAVC